MKVLIYFLIFVLLFSLALAVTIEQGIDFSPSQRNVTFQALENFTVTEIIVGPNNLTIDNITYIADALNEVVLNFSVNSTIKKFLNTHGSVSVDLEFYNLSTNYPYNDIYNWSASPPYTIITNANNYNITIAPGHEIRISNYSLVPPDDTIWFSPKSNYSDSLWMLDFGISGVPVYNGTACDEITAGATSFVNSSKKGAYSLSYNAERASIGTSEKRRFSLYKFPRRFYSNTLRLFFQFNQTLTANATVQVDINVTQVTNRTGMDIDSINTSTYRLYRINRNGGIYNDTGLCLEQNVIIG